MGSSVLGVILDSSIIIEAERLELNAGQLPPDKQPKELASVKRRCPVLPSPSWRMGSPPGQYHGGAAHLRRQAFLDDLKAALPGFTRVTAGYRRTRRQNWCCRVKLARGLTIPFEGSAHRGMCP